MDCLDHPQPVQLEYSIADCSEHSGIYVAENILVDKPMDQTSRWSGAYQSPNVKQWMLLRLASLSVLTICISRDTQLKTLEESITFGKYHKAHPCNMKEFKIYVGLTEDNMTEVLHAGLKNDSVPEKFSIRHINRAGICFPTRYVKIVPLSAHGQSFHTSIWHVVLSGISDESFVQRIREKHDEYREASVLRHVLKHLRQRRFLTPFNDILSRSGLQLEHPLVTELYDSLVLKGDWSRSERLLPQASSAGLFTSYRHACSPRAHWTRLHGLDADGVAPCRRGGHAMCMDEQNGLIYLFGGWDGQRSLDDFWVYDVRADSWRLLNLATSREMNGPGPRACHKMVFDSKTGSIYLLGRLGDGDALEPVGARAAGGDERMTVDPSRPTSPGEADGAARASDTPRARTVTPLPWTSYCSEFYRYHTRGLDAGKWDLLSIDTASSDGPSLIFDHQMVMDCEAQMIYVSGGRVVDGNWDTCKYSGLHAYDVRTGSWSPLDTSDGSGIYPSMPSRFGHSMVLEPNSRTLFIFAGQRDDKYLSDMYTYHIPTGTVVELFSNFTPAGGPDACFTQRAVIDTELREIYVFCGLTRNRTGLIALETESPMWIYRYERPDRPGKWSRIHAENPAQDEGVLSHDNSSAIECPQPRYAHQVVYDSRAKVVYMHGGNSGIVRQDGEAPYAAIAGAVDSAYALEGPEAARENRLDDFWKMYLERPPLEDIVRRATSEIRQQQFREMCMDEPAVKALAFLQTEVSSVVNHSDPGEAEVFRSLLSYLLATPPQSAFGQASSSLLVSDSRSFTPPTTGPSSTSSLQHEDQEMKDRTADKTTTENPSLKIATAMDVDPLERTTYAGAPPSPARFRQRTQVYERLLEFINEDARQPEKNLLDLVNTDGQD